MIHPQTIINVKKYKIPYNIQTNEEIEYKDEISVDTVLADEIKRLLDVNIKTTGCCQGIPGEAEPFISVRDESINNMIALGYQRYEGHLIYEEQRPNYFYPKSIDIHKYHELCREEIIKYQAKINILELTIQKLCPTQYQYGLGGGETKVIPSKSYPSTKYPPGTVKLKSVYNSKTGLYEIEEFENNG